MPSSVWIFGYGSLIWKADFPYRKQLCGYITGFNRRFHQHSIDHRGTEERPGRVVTLEPALSPTSKVFGVAYEIDPQVLDHLDYREKNGYERVNVQFYPMDRATDPIELIVYVATEDNCSFAGRTDNVSKIAFQVLHATGPSGRNREYVYNLANAMREMFPGEEDQHLFELEAEVKRLEAREDSS